MKTLAKRALMCAWEHGWMKADTVIRWMDKLNLRNA